MITYETREICKKEAQQMLASSSGNPRYNQQNKVNKSTVARYARDMKNGKWQYSPDPIAFNENGELVNGHHRLTAIVESDTRIMMTIARNVPNETTIFDRNLRRTGSQLLRFSEKFDKALSSGQMISAIKMWFAYELTKDNNLSKRNIAMQITDSEIIQFIRENEDLLLLSANATKTSGHGVAKSLMENSSCILALFSALKSGIKKEEITEFCKIVRTGLYESKEQTAAIMARNFLLSEKAHDFDSAIKRTQYVQTCLRDFIRKVPREKKYIKTEAYFTNKCLAITEK